MSDTRFLLACNRSDVEPGCVRCFEIDGHQIAIYNIDERFYATDDICTHGLSSLSTGELQGDAIECAAHFGVFHVPTGKVMGLPCAVPLRTYRVALQDEGVFVEI